MADVSLNVTGAKGKAAGDVKVPAELFGIGQDEVRSHVPLVHQVVIAQRARGRTLSRTVPAYQAAAGSHGNRRVQAVPARVPSAPLSLQAVR